MNRNLRWRMLLAAATLVLTAGLALPDCTKCLGYYNYFSQEPVYSCINGFVYQQYCDMWCCPGQPGTAFLCNCTTPVEILVDNKPQPCPAGPCPAHNLGYPCETYMVCDH